MSPGQAEVGSGVPAAGVVAAITVFRPDERLLADLVRCLRADGLAILVHVDGPTGVAIAAAALSALASVPGLTVLQSPDNIGVGAGLNRLARAAAGAGFRRVVLFDQDSSPPPGMVLALCGILDRLVASGARPAVIGPRPVAPAGEAMKPPRYRRGAAVAGAGDVFATDFVITSGSVVDLEAFAEIGPFREDYVIDAIDTEWCFRAAAKGRLAFVAEDVAMPHRVGAGTMRLGPIAFPRQSPWRMGTYIRNQMHGLSLPHVPLRWKLRTMIYVPLQMIAYILASDDRSGTAKRLLRAAADGVSGRLGHAR